MEMKKRLDLISRDRLLRDIYFQEGRYPESHLLRMAIGEQPTVDAVEVVHGRWESHTNASVECSVCDGVVLMRFKFCPHCGAKMDGERREGE